MLERKSLIRIYIGKMLGAKTTDQKWNCCQKAQGRLSLEAQQRVDMLVLPILLKHL